MGPFFFRLVSSPGHQACRSAFMTEKLGPNGCVPKRDNLSIFVPHCASSCPLWPLDCAVGGATKDTKKHKEHKAIFVSANMTALPSCTEYTEYEAHLSRFPALKLSFN
jgi:hypothetical protein